MKITTRGGLNTRQILASTIWDLKRDCRSMEDRDVAYDLGYIMGLCNSLGRSRLGDLVLNRFEPHAF